MAGHNDDLAMTSDGQSLLFTKMTIAHPNEIYKIRWTPVASAGSSAVDRKQLATAPDGEALTHLNDRVLSQVSMQALEPFWFTGAANTKVEGFILKPPDFDASKKYPVKFIIHGGPQTMWGDLWSYRWNFELLPPMAMWSS